MQMKTINRENILFFSPYLYFLVVAILYLFLSYYYTLNYPINADDVQLCLRAFNRYLSDQQIGLLDFLLTKKKIYPNIFTKAFTAISYYSIGTVNFAVVNFFGNIGVVLFGFFCFKYSQSNFIRILIPTFLFVPAAASFVWVSASTIYVYTLIMCFVCLFLTRNHGWYTYLIFPIAFFVALYTQSNGFLIGVPLIMFSLYQSLFQKKYNLKVSVFHTLIVVVFSYIYLNNLNFRSVSDPSGLSFGEKLLSEPFKYLIFSFKFNGMTAQNINFEIKDILALILGLFVFIHSSFLVLKNTYDEKLVHFYLIIIFLLGSAVLAGIGRSSPFAPRYEIISLCYSACYLVIVSKYDSRIFISVLAVIIILFSVIRLNLNLKELERYKYIFSKKMSTYLCTGNYVGKQRRSKHKGTMETVINEARSLNIYKPKFPLIKLKKANKKLRRIDKIQITENYICENNQHYFAGNIFKKDIKKSIALKFGDNEFIYYDLYYDKRHLEMPDIDPIPFFCHNEIPKILRKNKIETITSFYSN